MERLFTLVHRFRSAVIAAARAAIVVASRVLAALHASGSIVFVDGEALSP